MSIVQQVFYDVIVGILGAAVLALFVAVLSLRDPAAIELDESSPSERSLNFPLSRLGISQFYKIRYHRVFPAIQIWWHGLQIQIPGADYEVEQVQYVDPDESISPSEIPFPSLNRPKVSGKVTIIELPKEVVRKSFLLRVKFLNILPLYVMREPRIKQLRLDYFERLSEEEKNRAIIFTPFVLDPVNNRLIWRLQNNLSNRAIVRNYQLEDEMPGTVKKLVDANTQPPSLSALKDITIFTESRGDQFERHSFREQPLRVRWLVSQVPPQAIELSLTVELDG